MDEVLRAEGLTRRFAGGGLFGRGPSVTAAESVSFSLARGEVLVLAGESGSGKSTIARMVTGSVRPDSGRVFFEGEDTAGGLQRLRAGCQMVHQDPYDSINPRMRIGDIVAEPLEIHGTGGRRAREARVLEVLGEVGLEPAADIARRRPHELSGGQRQRVVLARALAPAPGVIIADEPVSMLDVSVRAGMLDLMRGLQKRHGISFLYITHDLATARHFGDRMLVLYRGRVVESGPVGQVLLSPRHPYTRALVDAVPEPDPAAARGGRGINILDGGEGPAGGCAFRPRCPYAVDACAAEPGLSGGEHAAACHVDVGRMTARAGCGAS